MANYTLSRRNVTAQIVSRVISGCIFMASLKRLWMRADLYGVIVKFAKDGRCVARIRLRLFAGNSPQNVNSAPPPTFFFIRLRSHHSNRKFGQLKLLRRMPRCYKIDDCLECMSVVKSKLNSEFLPFQDTTHTKYKTHPRRPRQGRERGTRDKNRRARCV